MTNHKGSSSSDIHCVFVETNFDTRLALLVHKEESISDFKEKLCREHKKTFPQVGDINITALKVKLRRRFFHLTDSMDMISKAFEGIKNNWFMYVDAVRVEMGELVALMDLNQNCLNPELLDKKKETTVDLVGHSNDLTLEEGLKTEVKKTKKRKIESSDGKKSRKKSSIDPSLSVVPMNASRYNVDANKAQVDVVASEYCAVSSREKMDDVLMGAIGKDIESSEKNCISVEGEEQTSEADRLCQEKILTVNSDLVDGQTRGEVQEVEANQTLEKAPENDLAMRKLNGSDEIRKSCGKVPIEKSDELRGAKELDLENGEKIVELVKTDQEKDILPTLDTSRDDLNASHEKLDGFLSGVIENDNERGEGSGLAPSAENNLETAEMVTYPVNQLEASSNLTTVPATEKKKKKRKMSSKDHINQSAVAATTTSRDIVNVDPISRRDSLGNPLVEAIQKENEMGDKSVEDVGRDEIETDNLASHLANHLDTSSGLTTPVTERKKRRKKTSKEHINLSSAATTLTSTDNANEIKGVPGNVDHVDATPESFLISGIGNHSNPIVEARQKENEMDGKLDDDFGSRKAIPSVADNIQTNDVVSYLKNQLEANSALTTGPSTEKKRKRKRSSKDRIDQSIPTTTISREILNEREEVTGSVQPADATNESVLQTENEMGDKFAEDTGPTSYLQAADLASTPVQESKMLGHIAKLIDENKTPEHEVAKDNAEVDAGEAKTVKSTKKKKSRKAKTPAKEDTLVASSAQNVEPIIKVVDGEEPDNVIRNVLDSLQHKKETEENLGKIGKKSSKKSKKKDSLNIVEARVLPVDVSNTAQKEVPLISNPKDTDILFEPANEGTESHLKKSIEVAKNTENNNPSKQILKQNADMGDNFGSSQETNVGGDKKLKQDQVTGGVKSEKEKKSLDLHPDGSIDGSLSSMKPKERKGRIQPASSGTSHLQSRIKNDGKASKVDRSNKSMKGAVNNKKETVTKSSNTVTVKKSTMNFFKDTELDSTDDESPKTASNDSTKSPLDSSSDDDDSDLTSMSRKQENNLAGGTNRFSGSLQDILRNSRSFKMAKLRASQSQPDDDSPTLDCVPDSQAN